MGKTKTTRRRKSTRSLVKSNKQTMVKQREEGQEDRQTYIDRVMVESADGQKVTREKERTVTRRQYQRQQQEMKHESEISDIVTMDASLLVNKSTTGLQLLVGLDAQVTKYRLTYPAFRDRLAQAFKGSWKAYCYAPYVLSTWADIFKYDPEILYNDDRMGDVLLSKMLWLSCRRAQCPARVINDPVKVQFISLDQHTHIARFALNLLPGCTFMIDVPDCDNVLVATVSQSRDVISSSMRLAGPM